MVARPSEAPYTGGQSGGPGADHDEIAEIPGNRSVREPESLGELAQRRLP
jgi:hypothetical protein